MRKYYVTTSADMPRGSGHWLVYADDETACRKLANERIPEGRWCFIYDTLEEVHELDRKRHGTIAKLSCGACARIGTNESISLVHSPSCAKGKATD